MSSPKYEKLEDDEEPGDQSSITSLAEQDKKEFEPLKGHTWTQPATSYGSTLPAPPERSTPEMGSYQDPALEPPRVIVSQPVQFVEQPEYLCYSLLAMLFCCFPLGIVALIFSIQTQGANRNRNREDAQRYSNRARTFATLAVGFGLASLVIFIIATVVHHNQTQNSPPPNSP
uniref:Transmembrane protein PMIS2 n=1 Tax=Pogona vitticeps TaxID=103695 RepID=A0ABM5ER21_9SAUR